MYFVMALPSSPPSMELLETMTTCSHPGLPGFGQRA